MKGTNLVVMNYFQVGWSGTYASLHCALSWSLSTVGCHTRSGVLSTNLHHAFAVAGVQVAGLLLWIIGQRLSRLQNMPSWAWPAQMRFLVSGWSMVGMIPLALNMRQPDLSGTPLSVEVAGVVEAVVAPDGAPPSVHVCLGRLLWCCPYNALQVWFRMW